MSTLFSLYRLISGGKWQLRQQILLKMAFRRKSNDNVERHDRSLRWFEKTENGVYVQKTCVRVKCNDKELLAVSNITASSSQSETLKVNNLDNKNTFYRAFSYEGNFNILSNTHWDELRTRVRGILTISFFILFWYRAWML